MQTNHNTIPRKIEAIIQFPLATAIISFTIGTVLFVLFMLSRDETIVLGEGDTFLIIGFFYVVIAFVINTLLLITLLILSFVYRPWQMLILQKAAVLLINIPVAGLYLYLIFLQ